MPRLPSLTRLAGEVRAISWAPRQTVAQSVAYVAAHRADLTGFDHPEDLGLAAYAAPADPAARAMAVNLQAIRNALAEQLWSREVFVGIEVLDELLFYAAKDPSTADPLMSALEFLRDRGAARSGLVIFPLHSLGVLQAGLLRGGTVNRAQYVQPDWGIAVSPQNNALNSTIAFVERARREFGVRKPVDPEDLRHWHRSRARWLEINPLIAIRLTTQRGSYYDTESVVLRRVRAATAQLAMVACFQDPHPDRPSRIFSSSRTNNWETLDIHHYIVLADSAGRRDALTGDCVPIQSRGARLIELTDLSIEIDPNFRGRKRTVESINNAISAVYRGHLAHMWTRQRNAQTRTYDRLFASLAYFLRSFHNGGENWSATVALSTAFEMLLTDSYAGGVTKRLHRRLGLVLTGVVGTRAYQRAFAELYSARGNLVHAGTDQTGLELQYARRAFVEAFCVMAPRVEFLNIRDQSPMRTLTHDR
jgi:hypothetical protein